MKRKKLFLGLILFILVCISTITLIKYISYNNYKILFKKIGKEDTQYENNLIDLTNYMYKHNPLELGISQNDLSYIYSVTDKNSFLNNNNKIELDKRDAISDINFLFNLFKYSYAGYSYFGGDTVFENSKESIIKAIKAYPGEKISSIEVENILKLNTIFIQDGHFAINGHILLDSYLYYSNDDISVYKSSSSYYLIENSERFNIKSINDDTDVGSYLKLSINSKGQLCYNIGILNKLNFSTKIKVTLQSKGEEIIKYIDLQKNSSKISYDDKSGYKYFIKNRIPILTMGRMYDADINDKSTELFAKSAMELKDEGIIVIDIRGNSGGNDVPGINWFKNFTGEVPQVEKTSIQLCSLINNYVTKLAAKNINYEKLPEELKKEYKEEIEKANIGTNKWYISKNEEKTHKNNTIIFALIDNKVASSGEEFLNYLRTLEKVILVGTNTSGVFISNGYVKSELPNSGIDVSFGNTISLNKYSSEGKGFQPDIWVNNADSLDRVLSLISKLRISTDMFNNI